MFLNFFHRRFGKRKIMAMVLAIEFCKVAAFAAEGTLIASDGPSAPAEAVVESAKPTQGNGGYQPPLASVNQKLNEHGITIGATGIQFFLGNPTQGEETMRQESLSLFVLSSDFNLEKIVGSRGSTIHFEYLWTPITRNLAYGNQSGDYLIGQPPPYIPDLGHLTRFSWEQNAYKNHIVAEFGKGNVGRYFAIPVCNQAFTCSNPLLQLKGGAGMNPDPYGNWFGRVGYHFTPALTLQATAYRSNAAFPFTNGWELDKEATDSNVALVDLAYRTTYQTKKLPTSAEVFYYHNTAVQTDPSTELTHKGTNGMYASLRQTMLRLPQGARPFPKAISAFSSVTGSFDSKNAKGLQATGNAGLIAEGIVQSRPFDSYGVKMSWSHNTDSEQRFLDQMGGSSYKVGATEFGVGPDANFVFSKFVLCPFAMRVWNSSAAQSAGNPPFAITGKPQDGWAGGITLVVLFDKILGLGPVQQH